MRTFSTFTLLALSSFIASAHAARSEVGVKAGYQLYSNDYSSPSTFAKALFLNTPLTDTLSLEGGLLLLGEAEELNHNYGAFNVTELSGLYHFPVTDDSELFVKAGIAPWFGYMTMPDGGQGYEFGYGAIAGLGYQFPLSGAFAGRVEYQYLPRLGGDTIGYTDSHFLSLGVSWHTQSRPLLSDFVQSPSSSGGRVTSQQGAVQYSRDGSNASHSSGATGTSMTSLQDGWLLDLYGSLLFDNNSSTLHIPRPFQALDEARDNVARGCEISHALVQGYSDATGEAKYNHWLSERRAGKVSDYLSRALGSPDIDIVVQGLGSERLGKVSSEAPYERRVDFRLRFQCWGK